LLESVAALRKKLEAQGSGLAVGVGKPSDVVPRLSCGAGLVYVTQGVCSEETTDEALVGKRLGAAQQLRPVWGNTLYFPEECGCDPESIPLLFTSFKNKAESKGRIRDPLDAPQKLPPLPSDDVADALKFLPTLVELGFPATEAEAAMADDPRGVLAFQGGEDVALARMQKWMFEDDKLKDYFEIRNGMLGEGYSSKFSPWLALGCLSPRRIWKEAQRYERERTKNKSTYWLIFELTWRDFYLFLGLSQGDKIFHRGGIIGDKTPWTGSRDSLSRWKEGSTGDQLVDANMKELMATGFMSNRGRQNVASYLIFDLGVDWRYGAAHFEEHLLDHDPCSNWGNWVAAAGLTGQRVNKFNTKKQLNDYDSQRAYVKHWLSGGSTAKANEAGPAKGFQDRHDFADKGKGKSDSGDKGKGKSKGKSKDKGGRNEASEEGKRARRWTSGKRTEAWNSAEW
jgi:deoxyribodipyrimidine photo-lyase